MENMKTLDTPTHGINTAAEMLGVSAASLRGWERDGKLPPARRTLGGHRRYSDTDIQIIREHINQQQKVWKP